MYKILVFIILTMFAINVNTVYGDQKITDTNWLNHPEIKEIRNIYKEITTKSEENEYRLISQTCSPEPNNRFKRESTILLNNEGVVKNYSLETTTEETASSADYFYDEKGVLRFMLYDCAYQNSGRITARIYFDKKGKEIYVNRVAEGAPEYCDTGFRVILNPKEHYIKYCF